MKSRIATTIEQSKKLAEILPIEIADMYYFVIDDYPNCTRQYHELIIGKIDRDDIDDFGHIPAWSLPVLMDVLPVAIKEDYYLEIEKLDYGEIGSSLYRVAWRMSYKHFSDKHSYEECETESKYLVDACVEMILKLHELKML